MTPTQQFIEDAIAGGWKGHERHGRWANMAKLVAQNDDMVALVLLDPLAWQAVGKTRGWRQSVDEDGAPNFEPGSYQYQYGQEEWLFNQHRFIDHLADGKTIDEALAAISQGI